MENWSDRKYVLGRLKRNGMLLELASPELQDDEEVVLAAIKKSSGYALQFASERLRGNKEIVLATIANSYGDHSVLKYVTENLKDDEQIILAGVATNPSYFKYASDRLKKDRDFILQVLGQHKFGEGALQYVDESLKDDREFIMQAIKIHGISIRYASSEIFFDREFCLKAVKENADALGGLFENYREDLEIVIEAAKQRDDVFLSTTRWVQDNEEFVIPIIEANPLNFRYASDRIKNDPKIIELYERKMEELGYGKEYWYTQRETRLEGANSDVEKAPGIEEEKKLTVEEQMQRALKTGDYATYKKIFATLPLKEKLSSIISVHNRYRVEKSARTPLAQKEADLRKEEQTSSVIGDLLKEFDELGQDIED